MTPNRSRHRRHARTRATARTARAGAGEAKRGDKNAERTTRGGVPAQCCHGERRETPQRVRTVDGFSRDSDDRAAARSHDSVRRLLFSVATTRISRSTGRPSKTARAQKETRHHSPTTQRARARIHTHTRAPYGNAIPPLPLFYGDTDDFGDATSRRERPRKKYSQN